MALSKDVIEFLERRINSEEPLPKIVHDFMKYVIHDENKDFILKMLVFMFPEKDLFIAGEFYSRSEGLNELLTNIHNEPIFMKELVDYIRFRSMFGE